MFAGNVNVVPVIAPLNEYVIGCCDQIGTDVHILSKTCWLRWFPNSFCDQTGKRIIPYHLSTTLIASKYWYDSYGNIRYVAITPIIFCSVLKYECATRFPFGTSQQSNLAVMIHDAFQPLSFWDNFMPSPNWQGVLLDTHIYQMFSVSVCYYTEVLTIKH